MENKIPEVAKMLGVEIGEEFYIVNKIGSRASDICGTETKYSLCDNKLQGGNLSSVDGAWLLLSLINGSRFIEKLPFKPKEGDIYYSYMWSELLRGAVIVNTMFVSSDAQCRSDYMLGNCYRTEAECEADTAMKERIEKMERCKW